VSRKHDFQFDLMKENRTKPRGFQHKCDRMEIVLKVCDFQFFQEIRSHAPRARL